MADADTYRRLLGALPEVEEGTGHGRPAWRVRGKFFAGLRDNGQTAVVKVEKGEKQLLMEAEPEIFFETPHYEGWGYFLVHLSEIEEDELLARVRLMFLNTHATADIDDLDEAIRVLRARAAGNAATDPFGPRIRASSYAALACRRRSTTRPSPRSSRWSSGCIG